jgi:hypothetical protein
MSKDLKSIATPVGELHWVNITGQGKQNYNEDGYEYVATVHLTGQEALILKATIDEVLGVVPSGKIVKSTGYRELLEDAEGALFTPTANKKEGTATGIFAFTFKTGATFEDGRQKKVAVYNATAQKVDMGDRLIGNGSKGAISGKMQRFERGKEVGVSLFLNAVQLTEYVPYEGDAGFEAQEGGTFTAPNDGETGFSGQTKEVSEPAKVAAKPRL